MVPNCRLRLLDGNIRTPGLVSRLDDAGTRGLNLPFLFGACCRTALRMREIRSDLAMPHNRRAPLLQVAVTYPPFQTRAYRVNLSQQDLAKSYSRSQCGRRRCGRGCAVELGFCRLNRIQGAKKRVVE
jgi:hypothetical protein